MRKALAGMSCFGRTTSLLILLVAVGLMIGAGGAGASTGPFVPTDLGTLGGTQSYARAVIENGLIIGRSTTEGDLEEHGFVWTRADGMLELTLGGSYSDASATNDAGRVIGGSYTSNDAANHAFTWSENTGTTALTLGGSYSSPQAVSETGQVIGTRADGRPRCRGPCFLVDPSGRDDRPWDARRPLQLCPVRKRRGPSRRLQRHRRGG